jgi:hypothetical protein
MLGDETLSAVTPDFRLVAQLIFRVAEAAHQLYAISTARADQHVSESKMRLADVVRLVATDSAPDHERGVGPPASDRRRPAADQVLTDQSPIRDPAKAS